jgi:hypothetical protein
MIFLLSPNEWCGPARATLEVSLGSVEKRTGFALSIGIEPENGWDALESAPGSHDRKDAGLPSTLSFTPLPRFHNDFLTHLAPIAKKNCRGGSRFDVNENLEMHSLSFKSAPPLISSPLKDCVGIVEGIEGRLRNL